MGSKNILLIGMLDYWSNHNAFLLDVKYENKRKIITYVNYLFWLPKWFTGVYLVHKYLVF